MCIIDKLSLKAYYFLYKKGEEINNSKVINIINEDGLKSQY